MSGDSDIIFNKAPPSLRSSAAASFLADADEDGDILGHSFGSSSSAFPKSYSFETAQPRLSTTSSNLSFISPPSIALDSLDQHEALAVPVLDSSVIHSPSALFSPTSISHRDHADNGGMSTAASFVWRRIFAVLATFLLSFVFLSQFYSLHLFAVSSSCSFPFSSSLIPFSILIYFLIRSFWCFWLARRRFLQKYLTMSIFTACIFSVIGTVLFGISVQQDIEELFIVSSAVFCPIGHALLLLLLHRHCQSWFPAYSSLLPANLIDCSVFLGSAVISSTFPLLLSSSSSSPCSELFFLQAIVGGVLMLMAFFLRWPSLSYVNTELLRHKENAQIRKRVLAADVMQRVEDDKRRTLLKDAKLQVEEDGKKRVRLSSADLDDAATLALSPMIAPLSRPVASSSSSSSASASLPSLSVATGALPSDSSFVVKSNIAEMSLRELFRCRQFWTIALMNVFSSAPFYGLIAFFATIFTALPNSLSLSVPASYAALLLLCALLGSLCGSHFLSPAIDRSSSKLPLHAIHILLLLAFFIAALVQKFAAIFVALQLACLLCGVLRHISQALVTRYIGSAHKRVTLRALMLLEGMAAAVGIVLMHISQQRNNSPTELNPFSLAYLVFAVMQAVAMFLLYILDERKVEGLGSLDGSDETDGDGDGNDPKENGDGRLVDEMEDDINI